MMESTEHRVVEEEGRSPVLLGVEHPVTIEGVMWP